VNMRKRAFILVLCLLFFDAHLSGGTGPSEWNSYCRKCHVDRPVNALYDPAIRPHKNSSLSCVGCHRDKGIAGHVKRSAQALRFLFQDMTLPPDYHPPQTSSVSSDDCLACHFYIREVDEIDKRKAPKNVRPIMLRASHGRHWDYRSFTPQHREMQTLLAARKLKAPLDRAEQEESDRLSQIEVMQCSRCHERYKKESPGGIDFNVNIAMKNPMECTACHIALRTAIHPGDTSPTPTAVSCERCHQGKLHQKMTFFPVDCGTEKDCLRCHPKYSPEELEKARPGQFRHKSTAAAILSRN
jgi:hypothetical protein